MTSDLIQHNKRLVWDFWQQLDAAGPAELPARRGNRLSRRGDLDRLHPFNELTGRAAVVDAWWQPYAPPSPTCAARPTS